MSPLCRSSLDFPVSGWLMLTVCCAARRICGYSSPARSLRSFVFGRFGTIWDEGDSGGPSVVVCICHLVALRVVEALCAFPRLSFSTFVTWSGESLAVEDGWTVVRPSGSERW